jgi:3-hydroxyisobutyrate dehydrogenase-like beta-hydroxyacid dehydrogenase
MARACDAVLLCVRGAEEVEDLVYGQEGVLAGLRPGFVLIDCTTSKPGLSRRIAGDFNERDAFFADAPLTRSPKDAEAGRLNSLVGAEEHVFAMIEPVLKTYSENIVRFGLPGAGHSAKLINNFITMGYVALITEGLALCNRTGVDAGRLYEVMAAGGADSGVLRKMVPPLLAGDFTGHKFSLGNACKDVDYFNDMVREAGFESGLAEPLLWIYRSAVAAGLADKLMASLLELYQAEPLSGIAQDR